jgi:hypothetical protein
MSEMSQGVKRDLEFIRSAGTVIEFDVSTGHSYVANLLRSREYWCLILNIRDRTLTTALLKALPPYSRGDVHLIFQPCNSFLFLIVLLRKCAVDVAAMLGALSPLVGGRPERRRIAKELMGGRDIIGVGNPVTEIMMLGLLHMLENASAPN